MDLYEAVRSGSAAAVRKLRPTRRKLNAVDPDSGESALEVAAERGDAAMVRLLLELGADANVPAPGLVIAAGRGDAELVRTPSPAPSRCDGRRSLRR